MTGVPGEEGTEAVFPLWALLLTCDAHISEDLPSLHAPPSKVANPLEASAGKSWPGLLLNACGCLCLPAWGLVFCLSRTVAGKQGRVCRALA